MKQHLRTAHNKKSQAGVRDERGTALIVAVTLLLLFALMGAAYVKFGYIELDETNMALRDARARQLAEAGVQAAIGRIHEALEAGDAVAALGEASYSFPMYKTDRELAGAGLVVMEAEGTAEVVIRDESGKINLNHAPASILQRVLEVDGATARNITASLPRTDGAAAEQGQRWLLNVDELLTRKLLTPEQFQALDLSRLTTFTVLDHEAPSPHFSVNTAPVEVLAAVLSLPLEQAQQLKQKGPFNSVEALAAAAGRPADSMAAGAESFLMQPNTFRIESTGSYRSEANVRSTARIEAVVRFHEDGGYDLVHWRVLRVRPSEAAEEAPPVAEAPEEVAPAEAEPVVDEVPAET
jgi:type II secretory pathway component PulK